MIDVIFVQSARNSGCYSNKRKCCTLALQGRLSSLIKGNKKIMHVLVILLECVSHICNFYTHASGWLIYFPVGCAFF